MTPAHACACAGLFLLALAPLLVRKARRHTPRQRPRDQAAIVCLMYLAYGSGVLGVLALAMSLLLRLGS